MLFLSSVSRSSRWSSYALAACSCALSLLLFEIGLRIANYRSSGERVGLRVSDKGDLARRENALILDLYSSNPRGGFDVDLRRPEVRAAYAAQGLPGLEQVARSQPYAVEFRYNARGFRDRPFEAKRKGALRVAVVGDSFTEGQGVRERDCYPRALERSLRRRCDKRCEALNFGRRGRDFPALYRLFEEALRWEPDLVIFGMVLNDVDKPPEFVRRWPMINDYIMVRHVGARRDPWTPRAWEFVRDRVAARRISRETVDWYRGMYSDRNQEGWQRTKELLAGMQREARRRRCGFGVVVWPLLVDLEREYPFEAIHMKLRRFFRRSGVPCLDLLETFRGRQTSSLWVHAADLHPNEEAHRLAAEASLPFVCGLLSDPEPVAPWPHEAETRKPEDAKARSS
ncbi:MAG: hypothetical protein JXO72_07110 [Vicinamibacteria bacterium]|nr:hypothetical protein [Vicinamibacteria bacterium]